MSEIKGYKVFTSDWTCRGFQYEVGKVFEEDVEPECGVIGFHFCEKAVDCFDYYEFDPNNKVAEVTALGEVATRDDLSCTNKIQIVREIPWAELLTIVNTGKECTGYGNSGDCNSGNRNSGDCNSGNRNSGNRNSGDCNSGNRNSGDCNSGNRNSGNWNSGDWNSGDCNSGNRNSGNCNSGNRNSGNWNSGDWNATNHSSGCFNAVESTIMLFNKPSSMLMIEWYESKARRIMNDCPHGGMEWIDSKYMTDEEKAEHPEHETTGGYLKAIKVSDADKQEWWNSLEGEERETVKALPNFDADIFYKCTGIKVGD